ncbi:MAG: NCS2 family permease [Bifidobacteriaceae bacterium]|jgi:AGZA family xanthine/uracil permease-like MFS transporter|nr:NCS2 family permease [Bifidobacteriaceae bacterium]
MPRPSPAKPSPKSLPRGPIDRFFKITERGSTIGQEVRGGLVTFFAMSYIIVLNPLILAGAPSSAGTFIGGGATPNLGSVAAGTALIAGVMTITMGLVANYPMAIASGLGINAVVTFTLAQLPNMSFADAMGVVVLEGVIILILVLTGFREAVFKAVPAQLKIAISVGIGLFIALIGLVDARFVTPAEGTPLQLGGSGTLGTWPVLVFVVGLVIAIILMVRKVRGALLIAIVAGTVLAVIVEAVGKLGPASKNAGGWNLNVPEFSGVFELPDFSILGQFSILGAFEHLGLLTLVLMVFSLLLADFFDTMGTMVAIGAEGGLLDKSGNPPRTKQILIVDSVAAIAGGAGGVSSNTAYIESAAGVGDGARTGLANIVTGGLFLLATFLAPLVNVVPYEAATPALVVVGFLMMMQVSGITWKDFEISIPAFLTIILMPFSYSITAGIGAGFVSFVIIKVAVGKAKQVHPLMWTAAVLFVIYFALEPIRGLLS